MIALFSKRGSLLLELIELRPELLRDGSVEQPPRLFILPCAAGAAVQCRRECNSYADTILRRLNLTHLSGFAASISADEAATEKTAPTSARVPGIAHCAASFHPLSRPLSVSFKTTLLEANRGLACVVGYAPVKARSMQRPPPCAWPTESVYMYTLADSGRAVLLESRHF
jgi:hypothetical protein